MKLHFLTAGALALTLAGTGCATKKYVANTVAPVEARVTDTEQKNTAQDEALTDLKKVNQDQADQLDTLSTDLSRANEKVNDVDSKATAAQQAAQRASDQAGAAQKSATDARQYAEQRADEVQTTLEKKLDAVNKYQLVMSETVLFGLNQYKLTDDAKAKLDDIASRTHEHARYIVEVQGFTDKTGSAETNVMLSEKRADSVTRYLVNDEKVPLHNINSLGSGYALPVADDSTRDGRKMNRRVEIRVFVPEMGSATSQTVAQK